MNSSADLQVGGGSGLGPSLPLPLIRQNGKTESLIVEQPTNLRLLNQRLTDAAVDFTTAHAHEPFFVCEWQRTLPSTTHSCDLCFDFIPCDGDCMR